MEEGECTAEDQAGRVLRNQVADVPLDVRKVAPKVVQGVALEPVHGDRRRRLRALTERERLGDELLAAAELTGREREHRPRGAVLPELGGLSELLGNVARRRQIG